MMRSMFAGVSGLKVHQTRMDTIGNNIANVNTTGFKYSRTTFADAISQTMGGAAAPNGARGGINPKQVGLGVGVASIDMVFTDGVAQATGKNTDVALSGNGLFVVKNNEQQYYTRNGAFEFDADGTLGLPGSGYKVQGWMAEKGKLPDSRTEDSMTAINIPKGKSMEAAQSTAASYTNNLNAGTKGQKISNMAVTYADGTSDTLADYNPHKYVARTITTENGHTIPIDATADYSFTTGDPIAGKVLFTSTVNSVTANTTGTVDLTLSSGSVKLKSPTTIKASGISSGTFVPGGTYALKGKIVPHGVTAPKPDGTIDVTIDMPAPINRQITVTVPKPTTGTYRDGDDFTYTFKIGSIDANPGAVLNFANGENETIETKTTVTSTTDPYKRRGHKDEGKIVAESHTGEVSYIVNGKKVKSVSLLMKDGSTVNGQRGTSYSTSKPYYAPIATTLTVYDSQGGAHSITVMFTKKGINTWELSLSDSSDAIASFSTQEDLKFDSYGRYVSGKASLSVLLKNNHGVENLEIPLNLTALTQYNSGNTIAGTTDGHSSGTLTNVTIDNSGTITGVYSNGVRQKEAQIAVAQFSNPSGLTKVGGSMYQESNNSGSNHTETKGKEQRPGKIIGTAGALGVNMTSSSLELSNVDIANEFSDMIVTQRGYQSNSKIITVSDEMLETLINMKR